MLCVCVYSRYNANIVLCPVQEHCVFNYESHPVCSTYTQRQGDPPQSAQDKARMDKEYLSLMAELGEAPIPASSGGHSNNNPPSGPRGTGPNTNQPPPVSMPGQFCSLSAFRDQMHTYPTPLILMKYHIISWAGLCTHSHSSHIPPYSLPYLLSRTVLPGWTRALQITGTSMACMAAQVVMEVPTTSHLPCPTWVVHPCLPTLMACPHRGCSHPLRPWARAHLLMDTLWVSCKSVKIQTC